jgi:hypothetical protein
LLEQLGLSIRNIWLHAQVGASNEVMTDILRQLKSACLVSARSQRAARERSGARDLWPATSQRTCRLNSATFPQAIGRQDF